MIKTLDYPYVVRTGYVIELHKAAIKGKTPFGCKKLNRLADGRQIIIGDDSRMEDLRDTGTGVAVYRRENHGTSFVPTGRIMVRVVDEATLESTHEQFLEFGYRIQRSLPDKINAGWLRHESGRMAEALQGCERLRRLDDVVFVEPEMLRALPLIKKSTL